MSTPALPSIADSQQLLAAADTLLAGVMDRARAITKNGAAIDDHQVLAERVAYAATEARAARELLHYAEGSVGMRDRFSVRNHLLHTKLCTRGSSRSESPGLFPVRQPGDRHRGEIEGR